MRAAFALVALSVALAALPVVYTACTPAQEAKIAQDLSPVGACVLEQAQAGADPAAVLAACAGSTIEAVIQIVSTFLAAKPAATPATAAQHDVLRAFLVKAQAMAPAGAHQ